jgi:hypothetical protein
MAIFKPGQIVRDSGVCDSVHPDMPHEVTVVQGRRFPTMPALQGNHLRAGACGKARWQSAQLQEETAAAR